MMGRSSRSIAKVNALLVDQMEPGGASVADYLQLPYVHGLCNASPSIARTESLHRSAIFISKDLAVANPQNKAEYVMAGHAVRSVTRIKNRYRTRWGSDISHR